MQIWFLSKKLALKDGFLTNKTGGNAPNVMQAIRGIRLNVIRAEPAFGNIHGGFHLSSF